jgi:hypothetical protein
MPNCDQCLEERPPHPEHQRRCGLNDCEFANGDQVEQGINWRGKLSQQTALFVIPSVG